MLFFDALPRNKNPEPKWLAVTRSICSVVGGALVVAYAAYTIEKVLEDSNAITTTVQIFDTIEMPNALICPALVQSSHPNLTIVCFHLPCTYTLLAGNGSYPRGSYGDVLQLPTQHYPCYHLTWNGGIINTTIEHYYAPGIAVYYAYDNGTVMSLTDYLSSPYSQSVYQWQISFFEPSTDPINTLFSPAPVDLTVPACYFETIICSGCVDITSCNNAFASVSDAGNRSQVIDYVLNGGYAFVMNSSQTYGEIIFHGMQIDISLTPSWKNRLGVVSETYRVSKVLMEADELPQSDFGIAMAFSFDEITPHGKMTVTTNQESRTNTALTALGAIGGIFTLIQGIYKLLFGKTAESPWGLVQNYTYGKLRASIFERIKDSYDVDGDNLPLTTSENPTPRSLEKLNKRVEAIERMLADHFVDASMLEKIQKIIEEDENKPEANTW